MKSLTELNTFSAESVAYDDQGTGAQTLADRYQINGLLDTAQPVMANIEKICGAAGSWLSYDIHEGQWGVIINTTGTSVASFDDTNILGSINISGTGITDLYNSVKVEFPHRDLRDSADFVTIEIADEDRNANEPDNTLNLTYDIINEPIQAQMLGFIELKQSRVDLIINFQTDYSKINVKAGDLIDVTNSRFGFDSKLFRVITVTEQQDTNGAIRVDITALEYDASVYTVSDLYRYTRTDENGIITLGSIGVPGTPQITKFEKDSRPRILVETTAPTGVVEAIEFWLTEDTAQSEDSLRSYRLIGNIKPTGGGVFTSGSQVLLEYDNLAQGDFYIKTRGTNASTVGPFSSVSGLIEYVPTQITDAIGPDTGVVDIAGNLLTSLAANYLLEKLGDLFTGSTEEGSLFKTITDKIEEITGIDLSTPDGAIAPGQLAIKDDGTQVTTSATNINFVGPFTVTADAGAVTVALSLSTVTNGVASGSEVGKSMRWNGTSWVSYDGEYDYQTPRALPTEKLSITATYPPDRSTFNDSVAAQIEGQSPDTATTSGSYFITFAVGRPGLSAGSGNAKLYMSDGTLVETLAIGDCTIDETVVELPFATRDFGTDYYITVDEGFVTYCDKISPAVRPPIFNTLTTAISYDRDATTWNFNTPLYHVDPYLISGGYGEIGGDAPELASVSLVTYFYKSETQKYLETVNPTTGKLTNPPVEKTRTVLTRVDDYSAFIDNQETLRLAGYGEINQIPQLLSISGNCPNSYLVVTFNRGEFIKSGNIYIKDEAGNTVTTLDITTGKQSTKNGSSLIFPRVSLTPGATYHVTCDAGVIAYRGGWECDTEREKVNDAYTGTDITFTVNDAIELTGFTINSDPLAIEDTTLVNPQSEIRLSFNRPVRFRSAGHVRIYRADGTLHQDFDIAARYSNEYINELMWWSGVTISSDVIEISSTPQIKDSGTELVLNPTRDMSVGQTYYVQITTNCIEDSCGSAFGGISNTTTVRFSIDPGPTASTTPISNDSRYITMTFDRQVQPGTGEITYSAGGTPVGSTDANDSSVEITTA